MAKDFRTAWAEIKAQRDQETRTSASPPAKTSPHRRRMAALDHLVNQLVDPKLESELADIKWNEARKSIYERDPRNFSYNTRLNSWGR